jgi:hypothetical protein
MTMRIVPIVAGLLGLLDLVLAYVYFTTPAGSLPTFLPGYETGSGHIHVNHAVGALVVAVVLFGVAWLARGPREA